MKQQNAAALRTINFDDLKPMTDGLVLLGCKKPEQWVKGVTKQLQDEGISQIPIQWRSVGLLTTTGGRIDVVLEFPEEPIFDIGKLAIWRLQSGNASWISDYVVNYAKQHAVAGI